MRGFHYLGSKRRLLPFLTTSLEAYTNKPLAALDGFADLFSGTGVVSAHVIRSGCTRVLSNDLQYYAHVASSTCTLDGIDMAKVKRVVQHINDNIVAPLYADFKASTGCCPTSRIPRARRTLIGGGGAAPPRRTKMHCKDADEDLAQPIVTQIQYVLSGTRTAGPAVDYVTHAYTPAGAAGRRYFTPLNGLAIDRARQHIRHLNDTGAVTPQEHMALLKVLLIAVSRVANVAVVYVYLKHVIRKAQYALALDVSVLTDGDGAATTASGVVHERFNADVIRLLATRPLHDYEVAYVDSPYNARSYAHNYHILETVMLYDAPELHGKTGRRPELDNRDGTQLRATQSVASRFCYRENVRDQFARLFAAIRSRVIAVSYSSDALVSRADMEALLAAAGWTDIQCFQCANYPKFSVHPSSDGQGRDTVHEYLFCGRRTGIATA